MLLGIDIGGTNTKIAVLENGTAPLSVAEKFSTVTPQSREDVEAVLEEHITALSGKYAIEGIGVGVPGMVDYENNVLVKVPNLPSLDGWNIGAFLAQFTKVYGIDNDVNCILRAESVFGAARGYTNALGIAPGTGIGGAIMIGGKIYLGAHGSAAEIGHMIVDGKDKWGVAVGNVFGAGEPQEPLLGKGIANLVNVLDPGIVVMGGGGIFAGKINFEQMVSEARKHIVSPLAKDVPIVKGELREYAQAIGAALLTPHHFARLRR